MHKWLQSLGIGKMSIEVKNNYFQGCAPIPSEQSSSSTCFQVCLFLPTAATASLSNAAFASPWQQIHALSGGISILTTGKCPK